MSNLSVSVDLYNLSLHEAASEHMNIPYQIYDEVLSEPCVRLAYMQELHNWAFSNCLRSIGLVVKVYAPSRFTKSQLRSFYEMDYCERQIKHIYSCIHAGIHPDDLAIEWLASVRKYDDIEVWFKGVKLFQ
jgi:hypothetical protein